MKSSDPYCLHIADMIADRVSISQFMILLHSESKLRGHHFDKRDISILLEDIRQQKHEMGIVGQPYLHDYIPHLDYTRFGRAGVIALNNVYFKAGFEYIYYQDLGKMKIIV